MNIVKSTVIAALGLALALGTASACKPAGGGKKKGPPASGENPEDKDKDKDKDQYDGLDGSRRGLDDDKTEQPAAQPGQPQPGQPGAGDGTDLGTPSNQWTPGSQGGSNWETPQTPTHQPQLPPPPTCLLDQYVKHMVVIINGAIASPTKIAGKAKRQRMNAGVPGQMTFEFNNGFAFTESQAFSRLMSPPGGQIFTNQLQGYKVRQIEFIRISLGGHSFHNQPYTTFDFLKGEELRYEVLETSQFALNTVAIFINGREFYRMGALNARLSAQNPTWEDSNVKANLVSQNIYAEPCEKLNGSQGTQAGQ